MLRFKLSLTPLTVFFLGLFLCKSVLASSYINFIQVNDSINESLTGTGVSGDPLKGRELVINRNKGNCLSCHGLPIPEEEFHGTIGPPLHTIGSRLSSAQIRLRIVDMKKLNPLTIMPGYFRSPEQFERVAPQFEGSTLLSASEIEHIVAYLITLKLQPSELSR